MRPLEIIIPILLAAYLLWHHPRPRVIRLLPSAAFLLMLIHLAVEGDRWQMIPLYVLTTCLMVSSLIKIRSASDWKPLVSYLTLIPLAVSVVLPIVLPVPVFPAPDGPYSVGTRTYELTDTSRKELYSGKDEPRRFQIQVWYPAELSPSDERASWMNHADIFARSLAQDELHLPPFFLDHLALVKLPAYKDSKVAASGEGYPIILFSHGWNGFNAQNTGQALQLASHGFIVVTVQHPYGAVVTVFDDGTIARNNPAALPMDAPDPEYDVAADKLVEQWAGDLAYALDFMTEQNSDASSPSFNKLDLARVGAYGHSTGGGAAIQFCGTDLRCKALLGQDPFMRPVSTEVLESGVTQPAFFMFSQAWADDVDSLNNGQFAPFYAASKNAIGAIAIDGTTHYDFSDLPLLSPLALQLGLKGPINGKRVTTIVDDYLLSFFEVTLHEGNSDLFSTQESKYDEVKDLR
jgi:predicted dienelactone hydrolase